MSDSINRITTAIDKYEKEVYSESDFHQTMGSILFSLLDSESTLRDFIREIENQLELIDFTFNKDDKRSEYLVQIQKIKDFIKSY